MNEQPKQPQSQAISRRSTRHTRQVPTSTPQRVSPRPDPQPSTDNIHNDHQPPPPARPSIDDHASWPAYWQQLGQPWRSEPEISLERQTLLSERRKIVPNIQQGIYPFKNAKLSRADVEWLLATHQDGRGPIDWSDEHQHEREGLNLCGADLSKVDLRGLPLASMRGGLHWDQWAYATPEQGRMAGVNLQEAILIDTSLEGANLAAAHLEGANLSNAHLEGANLSSAYLAGAQLIGTHLEGADLFKARLLGANLREACLEGASLYKTDLTGATLRQAHLEDVHLHQAILKRAYLVQAHLEDADLYKADLQEANLREAYLQGANLYQANVRQANLREVHLEGANLREAHLEEVNFHQAHLDHADLREAHLERANLYQAQLPHAHFYQAHLEGARLREAHLEHAHLGEAYLEGVDLSRAHLEQANLRATHLEGTNLHEAHFEGARLSAAHLEGAYLCEAHLEGAYLYHAHLEGKHMSADELQRVRQWVTHFPELLPPADLRRAFFDTATTFNNIALGNEEHGFVCLADVRWGGANLTVVKWSQVSMLGDERLARQHSLDSKRLKNRATRFEEYDAAIRANRQLSVALQGQGLSEDAVHFGHRSQVLQRHVLRRQWKVGMYLSSLVLDGLASLLAGYGYRPLRSIIVYLFVIAGFTIAYYALGATSGPQLAWNEALVISMTAFHGRGFFPGQFQPGDPQAMVAAVEAVIGLLIEISFIAIFTKRFFFSG